MIHSRSTPTISLYKHVYNTHTSLRIKSVKKNVERVTIVKYKPRINNIKHPSSGCLDKILIFARGIFFEENCRAFLISRER